MEYIIPESLDPYAEISNASEASNASSNASEDSPYLSASGNTGIRFGAKSEGTSVGGEPLSADLLPGESATLEDLSARRNGRLSIEVVLRELKGETPSRRMLNRYVSTLPEERTEAQFEYLAKTLIHTLADLPASDKDAWREYAPVVQAALKQWEAT